MATGKKVVFGAKPAPTANNWVDQKDAVETRRLTLDIPVELHGRIKSACALRGKKMVEEITKLLEEKYGLLEEKPDNRE